MITIKKKKTILYLYGDLQLQFTKNLDIMSFQ